VTQVCSIHARPIDHGGGHRDGNPRRHGGRGKIRLPHRGGDEIAAVAKTIRRAPRAQYSLRHRCRDYSLLVIEKLLIHPSTSSGSTKKVLKTLKLSVLGEPVEPQIKTFSTTRQPLINETSVGGSLESSHRPELMSGAYIARWQHVHILRQHNARAAAGAFIHAG
jgi:hypothetical protein